ncbi:MAG: hypothetical protein J0M20_18640 [Burkholderiales bacterium]|nr:hypothetical protein [Burkholderiales bacterium]
MNTISIQGGSNAFLLDGSKDLAGRRKAREAIGEALAGGDLEAARSAFTQFSEASAADRASRHPDGPFARLQAALEAGDLDEAKAAYQKLSGPRRNDEGEGARSRPLAQEGPLGRHIDLSA